MPDVSGRLIPPPNGVAIRMYRIGHGDCFLLAFPPIEKPVYVLIDCGYKPGSPGRLSTPTKPSEITDNIRKATNGDLDIAIITHEHQDHVNGITEKNFQGIEVGEAWFAWTEDPDDELAKQLRKNYKDQLLGILHARNRLAGADGDTAANLDEFLAFELGGDDESPFTLAGALQLLGANGDPSKSLNKKAMKLIKDRAKNGPQYLRPHEPPRPLPRNSDIRVFTLGPPRDTELLKSLDPEGDEEFHLSSSANRSDANYLASAAGPSGGESPFAKGYGVSIADVAVDADVGEWFKDVYGMEGGIEAPPKGVLRRGESESPGNPIWRRIDRDWLYSVEQLALDINDETNNGSLVLAFEMGPGGKVLLFAGDAQRGNWRSWTNGTWNDRGKTITARDLLGRTVLYKVGHHGSHNATLSGNLGGETPNLSWMGRGPYAREFVAFVTAVRKWAETQKGWDHPKKAIKDALLKKSCGRVFQTDTDRDSMNATEGLSKNDWDAFQGRVSACSLYFDYEINQ